MPRAATICAEPSCPDIATNAGRCPAHQPTPWANSTRRQRLPHNWDTIRQRVKARAHGQCEDTSQGYRCPSPGNQCDHVINNDNHSLSNLQWLCVDCHARKTHAEAATARRVSARRRRSPQGWG